MGRVEYKEYPRVWGIIVGKINGNLKTRLLETGLLDNKDGVADRDDCTTTKADFTALMEFSDTELDDNDDDFAIKNAPRPPPDKLMYNGAGTSQQATYDWAEQDEIRQSGRSMETETGVRVHKTTTRRSLTRPSHG